jgi:hypothetical protein
MPFEPHQSLAGCITNIRWRQPTCDLVIADYSSLIERASVCLVTVVPAGVLMGFMFPTGMRLCTRIDSRITPWLWALNGAGGVLASGALVLVSVNTSLNHSLWVGAVAYALLAVVGPQLLKLEQASEDKMGLSSAAR